MKTAHKKSERKLSGKFAVVLKSRQIGQNKPNKTLLFDDKNDAKAKAKRMNKILSRGEKNYYKMRYVIIELIEITTDGKKSYIIN